MRAQRARGDITRQLLAPNCCTIKPASKKLTCKNLQPSTWNYLYSVMRINSALKYLSVSYKPRKSILTGHHNTVLSGFISSTKNGMDNNSNCSRFLVNIQETVQNRSFPFVTL